MSPSRAILPVLLVSALLCSAVVSVSAAEYDASWSMHSLFYSKATSCPTEDLLAWNCSSCAGMNPGFQIRSVGENETEGTKGFIGVDGNTITIAFRGSDNLQNWLDDFDSTKVPYPNEDCGCEVHEGFLISYNSLREWVLSETAALLQSHPTADVRVIGHSLGGALAVHAALDVATNQMNAASAPLVELYTYGQPRVGDPTFGAWASQVIGEDRSFRVTHHRDPVNHLPTMYSGFLHSPQEIYYNTDDNISYVECNDTTTDEDPNCSNYVYPINVWDHLYYLGYRTDCGPEHEDSSYRTLHLSKEKIRAVMKDADMIAKKYHTRVAPGRGIRF